MGTHQAALEIPFFLAVLRTEPRDCVCRTSALSLSSTLALAQKCFKTIWAQIKMALCEIEASLGYTVRTCLKKSKIEYAHCIDGSGNKTYGR
jgi:hypothetical protein